MAASTQDKAFFNSQGAVGICSAFTSELKSNGKLEERGEPTIDAFVAAVNAKLTRTISDEDLDSAISWSKQGAMPGTQGGYILAQLIKQARAIPS